MECLEQYGAEGWLSDIVEWIWYTISEQFRQPELRGRMWTAEALGAWVRQRVQKHDEHVPMEPFAEDFRGREEPDILEVLECARPYLPREGAFGEIGAERRQGGLPGPQRRRRHYRDQPLYLHERDCLGSHLPARQPRPGRHPHPEFLFSTGRNRIWTAIWECIGSWRGVTRRRPGLQLA